MSFDLQMRNATQQIRQELDTQVKRIALASFQQINERSPVDQGTFRANWNVSIDTNDTSVNMALTESDWQSRASIASMAIMSNARLGTIIFISNSVPYAARLENGYSPQRPEGVVKPTAESISRAIEAGRF